MSMYITIDRFEGQYAVAELEDGSFLNVPRALFPTAGEGDVILIRIDKEATQARKSEAQSLVNKLFKD